jgi:hypothetical protein
VAGSTSEADTLAAGVWGDGAVDSSLNYEVGVVGTAGLGYGGVFFNNNTGSQTIFAENLAEGSSSSSSVVIEAISASDYAYNFYAIDSGLDTLGVDSFATGNGSIGVYGESDGAIDTSTNSSPIGVKGVATGVDGNGVVGDESGNGGYGVYARSSGNFDLTRYAPVGVYGLADNGIGVEGINGGHSAIYNYFLAYEYTGGVWGDTSGASNPDLTGSLGGVVGSADNNYAGNFFNNSADYASVFAFNQASGGPTGLFTAFEAATPNGACGVGSEGSLRCTGQLVAMASTGGGTRTVETYSVQSPENWMEDFGSGALQKGVAVVKIDSAFADTVTADASYHVFITPNGDSEGLYVINKTATSFEVRESKGGTSSLTFDYRIVGKRRGYEAQRLNDVTERFNIEQARLKRRMPAEMTARASRGVVEARMAESHPPISRLAKLGHPAHEQATKPAPRIRPVRANRPGATAQP